MSKADIDRFVEDLKSNADLLEEVRAGAGGLASIVAIAKSKGYDITLDDAKEYIRSNASRSLSDDELDQIAGGVAVVTSSMMDSASSSTSVTAHTLVAFALVVTST